MKWNAGDKVLLFWWGGFVRLFVFKIYSSSKKYMYMRQMKRYEKI